MVWLLHTLLQRWMNQIISVTLNMTELCTENRAAWTCRDPMDYTGEADARRQTTAARSAQDLRVPSLIKIDFLCLCD